MAVKSVSTSDERAILTVGQVNAYIKQLLESNRILSTIYIRGEISNFTDHYRTGHLYFSLKDETGVISAVMFNSAAKKLKFIPENGMKVIVHGRISAFVKTGQYQIYADHLEPDGIGGLYLAYEQLKNRLEAEGLFSPELKKPLPRLPLRIGIITSPTGAAIRDMINILGRRFPLAEVIIYPSLVQGDGAAEQLCGGVIFFSTQLEKRVDLIIIGRGGGSMEDLWAFNDERLARLVASSDIPIISAVGHETDFTICDFAADLRAPTPSAAAELAVPEASELKRRINNITAHMSLALEKKLKAASSTLSRLENSRALKSPQSFVDDKRMQIGSLSNELEAAMKLELSAKRADFSAFTAALEALSPMAVLSRGYAAVFSENGDIVKSVKQLAVGECFKLHLSDGTITGETKNTEEGSDEQEKRTDL